jgi:class 3 adenylate cyclase/tetratricopeptide (TPR) repeat protein
VTGTGRILTVGRYSPVVRVERRIVSVLFADLVGFTSLSERLDPEDVAAVQDVYFATVRETVGRYGGHLEKFIGDAAMAVFGIPRTRDDDAERAVRAGLALVGAVEQLSAKVGLGEGDLRLRVGVNTGEVVHSEGERGEWLVTGDTVNVAARYQTAAQPDTVVIGEQTALAVAEAVELEPMGAITLKGKAEPVRAWTALGTRPAPSRDHAMGGLRAPTLGRDEELGMLAEAVVRVKGGGAERWVVVAPPGVGKSRLVEEFARQASGALLLRARLRPDVLAPYDAVAQLFASALGRHGWDAAAPNARERLEDLLSKSIEAAGASPARGEVVIREVRSVLLPDGQTDEGPAALGAGEREQRFGAWLEALDALAAELTQAWIVEDVHWAGGDLLAFLAMAGGRGRRLILATSRPSLLERAPEWCQPGPANVLHLASLSTVASEALATALIGDALPTALVSAIAERSDGNPLFIEELLRTWVSVGTLTRTDEGGWALAAAAEQVSLPATVQAIYAAQLDDLSPSARRAARHAAVAGRRFPRAALAPMGVTDPDPAIQVLTRRALVAGPFADPLLGPSHQFRHALLRDAGYASLARAERARLHVTLAQWLEEAAGARWAEVAEVIGNHYRAALTAAPALAREVGNGLDRDQVAHLGASWFERASSAAIDVAAHDAARALLLRALDLTPDADLLARARRWQRLGDATAYVADMDEGAKAFETAADLYKQVLLDPGSPSEDRGPARTGHAESITALGLVRIQQLRFEESVQLANAALDAIGPADDLATAWLWYLRAWGTTAFAYKPEVKEDLKRALVVAKANGDRRLELEIAVDLADLAADRGDKTRRGLGDYRLVIARTAADVGDWQQVTRALRARAMLLVEDRVGSAEAIREAAEVAEAHASTEDVAWADYVRVEMGLFGGNWIAALGTGVRALDMADANAYHRVQVRTWFALSPIALATGRRDLLERAAGWFERHEAIFPHSPFGNVMHAAVDYRLRAAGLLPPFVLDPEDILPAWEESQGLPSWTAAVEAIVEGWLEEGNTQAVRRVLERVAAWHDHPMTEALGRGSEALLRARLLMAEGDTSGSAAAATEALGGFRKCRAPWWTYKALRALQDAGAASAEDVAEARAIEASLNLVRR